MLSWSSFAWVLATSLQVACAQPYFEGIVGQGLIGSHFGLPFFDATFDYVIVGGGTAGLAIATRLAENATNTVAVIEAGGFYEMDNGNASTVPSYVGYWLGAAPLIKNPAVDWEQFTEPMAGFGGRSVLYTQGKTLGGGSGRNYMLYHRSTINSFQLWADTVEDQSYTFEKLLPFFKRSVSFDPPRNDIRPANSTPGYNPNSFNPRAGPLKVGYPNWSNSLSTWIKLGLAELGLSEAPDFTSGSLLGYQYVASTISGKNQTRSSSQTSFLRQALRRTTNMNVYQSTLAKRILFDSTKKATGVVVNTAGVQYTLFANKEVILSAGAFRSPQLLMVSGVGPAATLNSLNIPVVADRPGVGQNMWDHVFFGPTYAVKLVTHSALLNPIFNAAQVLAYISSRTGQLTNQAIEFLSWQKLPSTLRSKLSPATQAGLSKLPADWPEVEMIFTDAYTGDARDLLLGSPQDGRMYGGVSAALLAPFSRGNVTISSTDTAVNPVVNPNLLLDPRDQEVAVQVFKLARSVFTTKAVQPVIQEEVYPGTAVAGTDAQILDAIKTSAMTVYHASATNAMGTAKNPQAVVDSHARVFGVSSLRVVDASIFPFLPPGHPQSLVYALAEKIAEDIMGGQTPDSQNTDGQNMDGQ